MSTTATTASRRAGAALEVLWAFLKLGCTSFGGPVAHLGYFRAEFVARRRWVDEATYADIVALCQLLPGPASSQTGISLGLLRAGIPGAFCAWLGFSAPSALALILAGYGVSAGPAVGRLLSEIEAWWEEGDFRADRVACLAELTRRLVRE